MFLPRPVSARTTMGGFHSIVFVALFALVCVVFAPASPALALDDEPDPSVSAVSSSYINESFVYPGMTQSPSFSAPKQAGSGSLKSMLALTELSPTLIRPSDEVRVELTVTNTTDVTIKDATVNFNLMRLRFSTRTGLDTWDERELGDAVGSKLASETLKKDLAPGKTATFQFKIPAADFALLSGLEGWGPRGATIELWGKSANETTLFDALNTYILWYPAEDEVVGNLNVATVVPVTGVSSDPLDPAATHEQILASTAKKERLSKVLNAVSNADGVSLAVDPALIQSIHDAAYSQEAAEPGNSATPDTATGSASDGTSDAEAGASATSEPTPTGESETEGESTVTFEQQTARTWLELFKKTAKTREILALPAYDVDFVPYAKQSYEVTRPKSTNYSTLTGIDFSDYVSWPLESSFSRATAHSAGVSGYPITIAESGVLESDETLTYTPSAVTSLSDAPGTTVFDADERLTEQLTTPGTNNAIEARQRLVAELAVISKEQPSKTRTLVIAPDRTWSPNSTVAALQLSTLASLPWVSTQDFSSLTNKDAKEEARSVPEDALGTALFKDGQFAQLHAIQRSLMKFSKVAEEPKIISAPHQRALARLASQEWRHDLSGQQTAITAYEASTNTMLSAITVVPSSDINLISTGAEIPLTVKNDLNQAVSLKVRLNPNDPRLQAKDTVPLEIEPNSSQSVRIPVTAVGSGNVDVSVEILDSSGVYITSPGTFSVRVRADWENVGTGVVLSLLALLLVGGIWRTIRRGRSERRVKALDTEEALAIVEAESLAEAEPKEHN